MKYRLARWLMGAPIVPLTQGDGTYIVIVSTVGGDVIATIKADTFRMRTRMTLADFDSTPSPTYRHGSARTRFAGTVR